MSAAEKTAERHSENMTLLVLADVRAERRRQHARWGEQNLPDGTGIPQACDAIGELTNREATPSERQKREVHLATRAGTLSYSAILLEEVLEALEESDPAKLRAELVQVAAVAVQWIEALDRRERGGA